MGGCFSSDEKQSIDDDSIDSCTFHQMHEEWERRVILENQLLEEAKLEARQQIQLNIEMRISSMKLEPIEN